ncbi:hypothetical protein OUZ56_015457 [Daphnia magna]|uniref:Uncharacterized protein n=1 Tax=Daphnia magna TaxID=35525 RepID=A0ABR0AMX0_9CRUS|nr:hypothetical protein OUZ56_015457 [Daphnia magna]
MKSTDQQINSNRYTTKFNIWQTTATTSISSSFFFYFPISQEENFRMDKGSDPIKTVKPPKGLPK